MSDFPFDLEPYLESGEPLRLGELLKIPRYGSLTVEEWMLVDAFYEDVKSGQYNDLQVLIGLTTILIKCRLDKDWTAEQTAKLPLHWIEAAADFTWNEQNRWKKPKIEEASDEPPKKPNWGQVYWRLKTYYPHETRFNKANFAKCPVWQIEQALEEGKQIQLEQAQLHSASAARLGVLMARVHGSKNPETRHFNEAEFILFHQKAVAEIEPKYAAAFMRLHKIGRIPEWLLDQVDVEVMRVSAASAKD